MFTNDWDNLGGGAHRGWITSPVLIGTADTPGNAYNLCLSGNYAFIADYGKGVQIIDINIPAAPSLVESYLTFGDALNI